MKNVKFLRPCGLYGEGEQASFDDDVAERMVKSGAAEFAAVPKAKADKKADDKADDKKDDVV